VVVVVCEFGQVEQVGPVILLSVAEHADVGLDPLVVILDLSLGLWVVGGQEPLINVQGLEEALGVIGCESGASVCVVDLGDPVVFPHVS